MSALIPAVECDVDYCLKNPGEDSYRALLCYATLDMSLGHILRDKRTEPDWFIHSARNAIVEVLPKHGTCALVDTTTLVNGARLVDPNHPIKSLPAGAIFDLATFLSACIFEDNILFLENPEVSVVDLNRILPDVSFTALPWSKPGDFGLIIENAWGEAERHSPILFRRPEWKNHFLSHWSHLIGVNLEPEVLKWPANYRKYFSSIDSQAVGYAICNKDVSCNLLTPVSHKVGMTHEFITESSIRAVFYSIVANILEATYYASSFRSRLRDLIYDKTVKSAVRNTTELFRRLNTYYQEDIASDALIKQHVQLPFVLSAAVSKVHTCSELCGRIADLRKTTKPLRDKRAELETAIRNQDQAAVSAIRDAVTESAKKLSKTEYGAGRGILSTIFLAPGGTRPLLGALGKLLSSFAMLPENVQEALKLRFVRPELWIITRLSAQARQTINALDPLYTLLKTKGLELSSFDYDQNLSVLKRFAKAQT